MNSDAKSVAEYLSELSPERRDSIQIVRDIILKNLDAGFEEGMQYGMIGFFVPHRIYPAGYHCNPALPLPFANLASQKSHLALYLMCMYTDAEQSKWFREEWEKTGKKLDMGKSCIRFKKANDLPLELIGKAIARISLRDYIAHFEALVKDKRGKKKS